MAAEADRRFAAFRTAFTATLKHLAQGEARYFLFAYFILLPFYLAPLFVTRLLPGLDLPFHLALVDMLHKVHDPQSAYGAIFDGTMRVSPYLGYLFSLWLLSFVVPLGLSHKLLFAAYIAALPLGLARLLHSCGRSRIPALLAFPLCYNMAVHYGFMSFALSLPFLVLLLAEVARVLSTEFPLQPRRSLLLMGTLGIGLFLFHLLHYAFFLCVAGLGVILCRTPLARRLVVILGLVPSLMLGAYWRIAAAKAPLLLNAPPNSSLDTKRGVIDGLKLIWDARHDINIQSRLTGLSFHMLKGFSDGVDKRASDWMLGLIAIFFLIGVAGYLRKNDRPPPAQKSFVLVGPIALIGALLAYLTLPHHLRELEVMTLFPRFSVTLGVLLPLIIPAALSRHRSFVLVGCTIAALGIGIAYGVELSRHYRMFARETVDFVRVLDRTPAGGKAAGLVFDRHSRVLVNESILVGLPSYYPVERRAETSLVDILYCDMQHMPCRTKDPSLRPPIPQPWTPKEFKPDLAVPYFDYFFVRSGPSLEILFGNRAAEIEILAKLGSWVVYRKKFAVTPTSASTNKN